MACPPLYFSYLFLFGLQLHHHGSQHKSPYFVGLSIKFIRGNALPLKNMM
jgi:hypothetical protein